MDYDAYRDAYFAGVVFRTNGHGRIPARLTDGMVVPEEHDDR